MLGHPAVQSLMTIPAAWDVTAIDRHNAPAHPIQELAVLADLGLRAADRGIANLLEPVLAH